MGGDCDNTNCCIRGKDVKLPPLFTDRNQGVLLFSLNRVALNGRLEVLPLYSLMKSKSVVFFYLLYSPQTCHLWPLALASFLWVVSSCVSEPSIFFQNIEGRILPIQYFMWCNIVDNLRMRKAIIEAADG